MQNDMKPVSIKNPSRKEKVRIGIYPGTFDPVHAGHVAFALQAARAADLDKVYFMPERFPRHKQAVEHFGHRTAMLARALEPHAALALLETPGKHFSVKRTMPYLRTKFSGAELVMLCGSDTVAAMPRWRHVETMLADVELCIGARNDQAESEVLAAVGSLPVPPRRIYVLASLHGRASSTAVRRAIRSGKQCVHGTLSSVYRYARLQWLYINPNQR